MRSNFLTLIALILPSSVLGGEVLFWMDYATTSHLIVWKPLATELARRGHHITFVGPKPDKLMSNNENITYVHVNVDFESSINSTDIFDGNYFTDVNAFYQTALEVQRQAFNLPLVQDLIKKEAKFDVALFSMITNDIGIYLAKEVFDAPIVFFFFGLKYPLIDLFLGNPINPSYIPVEYLNFGQSMTFLERLANSAAVLAMYLSDSMGRMPGLNANAQELLGLDEKPDLMKLSEDAAFGLFNSHAILDGVRPLLPNTAEVGPIHVRPAERIEDEPLRKWFDDAKDGFIYVSYGTILSGSKMPESKRQMLVEAFKGLEERGIKVLWKWETEEMEGKPDNILLKKWLPQQDVLGHPNCKMFITHGGLMSTYESLYHGVPMVVMPGFSDQFSNAARAEREGYGRSIYWWNLESDELLSIIKEVLDEKSYQDSVAKATSILRDQLVDPVDKAAYYVEYVMRHKGAPFLRSPVKDLYWFQSLLLDVALFVFVILAIFVFILYKIMALVLRCLLCQKSPKMKTQ